MVLSKVVTILTIFFMGNLASLSLSVPQERYANWPDLREHPGHYPFISYLTFRNACDIIIDQTTETFDPDIVKQGDIIYLNIWYLEWFARDVHDKIKHPYILVTSDVGNWLPHPDIKKLLYDPKLAAWFCRNIIFSYHPKLFQIPMGQDLALFQLHPDVVKDLLGAIVKKPLPKKHFLYMCHYPRPYGDRDTIVKMFENEPYCFSRNHSETPWDFTPRPVFYDDLLTSKFVLSPLGLEHDCVRTWETLALDCVPIVEHTFLDPLYEGLPVIKVHDWNEVNEKFLEESCEQFKDLKLEKVYFDYWEAKLKSTQAKVKNHDLDFSRLDATKFTPEDLSTLLSILEKAGPYSFMIYKGALTGIRPLQLANNLPSLSSLILSDHWLDLSTFQTFDRYLADLSILRSRHKIAVFEPSLDFECVFNLWIWPCPVFLDLTYFRIALNLDHGNLRHKLWWDLDQLYKKIPQGTLISGNMVNDEYVSKVLQKFSRHRFLEVEVKGNFWFFIKK